MFVSNKQSKCHTARVNRSTTTMYKHLLSMDKPRQKRYFGSPAVSRASEMRGHLLYGAHGVDDVDECILWKSPGT